ncbi:MAG TPA: hypothetical protein VHW60_17710 [Caulobacteraceae bacterium]|nr:hypothetical protein [Caulobacteraceae bacterium]
MTCLGFQILAPDRAVAWADSEVFVDDEPDGDRCKLFVNPLARFVVVGSGRMAIFTDAVEAMTRYLTFDEAVSELPGALRRSARHYSDTEIAARAPLDSATVAVVGSSQQYGRIVGAVLHLHRDFEPLTPQPSYLSPYVAGAGRLTTDRHGIISIASEQLVELRRFLPLASGGALVTAEVTREGVRCGPTFDLRQGREVTAGWWPQPVEGE